MRQIFAQPTALSGWVTRGILAVSSLLTFLSADAQTFSHPGEYNNYIVSDDLDIAQRYLAYISEVAHSNSMRRIERKRERLVSKVEQTYNKMVNAPFYKGDGMLRNAAVEYYKSMLRILNDDYGKIVQLENVSQDSYENMEAYYKSRDDAEKKYESANQRLKSVQQEFAKKYELQLVENSSMKGLEEKFEKIDEVNEYYEKAHLLFFKAYKTEALIMQAIRSKDYATAEKKRQSLSVICKEGLEQASKIGVYNNDESLIGTLKNYLIHCSDEADVHLVKLLQFPKKQIAYETMKSNLESIPKRERTQADIDRFNKAVSEYNAVVTETNSVAEKLNREGQFQLEKWNNAVQSFMDKYIPHYEDEVESA